jgi:Ca2+-binding RTX toxin-like protein
VSRIDGGLGDDRIASTVVADFAYGITKATNRLDGFDGNDRLIARLEMPAPEGEDTPPVSAFNRLDGGAGNDVMNATVTGLGRSITAAAAPTC